jgi:mono/diheme cytochrome c family protein
MPGMGGQVLSDDDLDDVVNYLRALQDPRRFPGR